MRHLVAGHLGEVGKALFSILNDKFETVGVDKAPDMIVGRFEVIHVCFPFSSGFSAAVEGYRDNFGTPDCLVIVHSTVPVGTCTKLQAVHSPIRGIHPELKAGIQTFRKFFGGPRAAEAARLFLELNIPVEITLKAETTEFAKLFELTLYGMAIAMEKDAFSFCFENGLDFDVAYKRFGESYNDGYTKLGHPEFVHPVLEQKVGPIGGHCVIQAGCEFLKGQPFADYIVARNSTY